MNYYYAHFDVSPSYLRDVYFRSVTGGGPPVFQPGELPDFRRELDALFQDQTSGAFGFAAVMQSCLRILSVAMMRARYGAAEREQELSPAPSEVDLSILSHAIELIDERLGEPVNVQGLCRELGVSYSFLYKLFVKMFNQPPTKYILQKKLSAAERLISRPWLHRGRSRRKARFLLPQPSEPPLQKASGARADASPQTLIPRPVCIQQACEQQKPAE